MIVSVSPAVVTVSIHALLAECDSHILRASDSSGVSIHALLAECDPIPSWVSKIVKVSIHALLAECDLCGGQACAIGDGFNPRTPCGVRLAIINGEQPGNEFQSTHSLRSATLKTFFTRPGEWVSIHALLAECDVGKRLLSCFPSCFNPRTPCGVRLLLALTASSMEEFQSTHSLRSATLLSRRRRRRNKVSIHALLAECDYKLQEKKEFFTKFQSTHSLRSATAP